MSVLLNDAAGELRSIQVHYDGEKAIFSYGKGGDPSIHLYEIDVDGNNLTRITPDDNEVDISPCYLPNGGIVFTSTRSHRAVACSNTDAVTLHRCRADGSRIFPISASLEHERGICALADGRLLFSHWGYCYRGPHYIHALFTCNPDGTGVMTAFGNMHPSPKNWFPDTACQMPESACVMFEHFLGNG